MGDTSGHYQAVWRYVVALVFTAGEAKEFAGARKGPLPTRRRLEVAPSADRTFVK